MTERRILDWLPDYDISECGEVRRITPTHKRRDVPYVLKNTPDNGYLWINACLPNGSVRKTSVHRLVCEAFHGKPPEGRKYTAHNDGDGTNNSKSNLRWATQSENLADRKRHGTDPTGERGSGAKLTAEQVKTIRQKFTGKIGEQTAFAAQYGVTVSAIHSVVRGHTWK